MTGRVADRAERVHARGRAADAEPMYNPTPEQAEADRKKAYETGIPHGA